MGSRQYYEADPLAFCATNYHNRAMTTHLWQRLRQARRYADMTQADLAARCGVSRGAVALWEAAEPEHRTKPTTDHLINISRVTKVPLEWLLNDAADLESIWRIGAEFGGADDLGHALTSPLPPPAPAPADVLPDIRHGDKLFLFAQTPEQIAAKLQQLAEQPANTQAHLVLIGAAASIRAVATPADALSAVVQILTEK